MKKLTQQQKQTLKDIFRIVSRDKEYKITNVHYIYGKKESQINFNTNSSEFIPVQEAIFARGIEWRIGIGIRGGLKFVWISYTLPMAKEEKQIKRASAVRWELKFKRQFEWR